MTNIDNLITAVEAHAIAHNKAREAHTVINDDVRVDRKQIKVEEKKRHVVVLPNAIYPGWCHEVPNDFCVFIDTLDDEHCAAYVYVLAEEGANVLKITLVISDGDGGRPQQELPSLHKDLSDDEIASQLVRTLVTASDRNSAISRA